MTYTDDTQRRWDGMSERLETYHHFAAFIFDLIGDNVKYAALCDLGREAVERRVSIDARFRQRVEQVLSG